MFLAKGTQLGPYQILSEIRAGGMGEVYRARDTRLQRDVAVKVLPADFSQNVEWQRRFELEARAAGSLKHPNILVIYDVGTHNGSPYLVSELLEGETLRERLAKNPLDVAKTLSHALQIVRGLAAVHEQEIVHRDLKPENLFITKAGQVKILDFGLAKLKPPVSASEDRWQAQTHVETTPGVLMGTIGYMSPEQVRGEAVDHRSDIFSFGAILYEMLAGRPAFREKTANETNAAILNLEPPDLPETNRDVTAELALVVRHCLEKQKQERYQSANDLAFNLSMVSAGRSSIPSSGPPVTKTKRRLLLPAIVLLLIVGFAGWLLFGRHNSFAPLSFRRLTFRRGFVQAARFVDKGIVYSAEWDGKPCALYRVHPDSAEYRPKEIMNDACLLAVSRKEELAILRSPIVEGIARYRIGMLGLISLNGGEPRDILPDVRFADWSPDETLAAQAPEKRLAVIRDVGNKRRVEFPIGHSLYESEKDLYNLRFSPKGNLIAFFERTGLREGKFAAKIIDLNGSIRAISHGWYDWWGLAWLPAGDEVLFSASQAGTESMIYALNLAGSKRPVFRAPGTLEIQDISSDGSILVMRTELRQFLAFRTAGLDSDRDLSWLDQSRPAELSADGKTLLLGEHGEGGKETGAIFLRTTDGLSTQPIGAGYAVALSPDGTKVFATLEHEEKPMRLIRIKAPIETKAFELPSLSACSWANWFPNNEELLLSCKSGNHYGLYILNTANLGLRQITRDDEDARILNYGNALSPDGRRVAAVVSDGGAREKLMIYTVGTEKTPEPPVPMPAADPRDRPIQWSADGRYLYLFRRSKDKSPAIVNRVEVATGRVEPKSLELRDSTGAWIGLVRVTPDGQFYCYSYSQTLSDLYLLDGLKIDSGWKQ